MKNILMFYLTAIAAVYFIHHYLDSGELWHLIFAALNFATAKLSFYLATRS
jgi:hypothetical protein